MARRRAEKNRASSMKSSLAPVTSSRPVQGLLVNRSVPFEALAKD